MADYIRRDIVLKIINTVNDTGGFAGYADYCVLFDEIDTMPASDVQPVRCGKWNIKDNHFHSNIIMNYAECSCCGHTCSTTESTHNNYCPNCGARMIKDGEHND